tara:strand:+ start:11288 stop:13579 length:2292 start_codon:yes stop_codon:yes gene_type:complete
MTLKTKYKLLSTTLAATLVATIANTSNKAYAEEAVTLEEIVVTAQKRSENLQEVPIAVTAMSGKFLEDSGIVALDEVSTRTPGFTMSRFNMAQPQLFIRGIGSTDDSAFGDQSVGVFVDEVYVGRAGGSDFDLMDLERLEVLRGPQGTLYGKNVVGGAVNIITKKPSAETQVKLRGSYGNFNRYELRGLVNGALSDTVNAKLSLSKVERDGHSTSSIDGSKLSDENNFSARAQLLFTPNEEVEFLLSADYSRDRLAGNSRDCFGEQFVFFPWFAPGQPLGASPCSEDPFVNEKTVNGFQNRDVWGVSGKITWQTGLGELTSITAYRNSDFEFQEDFSGSDANLVINNVDEDAKQFSQELRLGDVSEDGRFKWIAGLYYFNEKIDRLDNNDFRGNDAAVMVTPSPVPGLTWGQLLPLTGQPWGQAPFNIFFDQFNTTNSYAAFGQATYDLTQQVSITLGARYTHEKKDAEINGFGFDPTGGFLAAPYDVSPSQSWNSFTPKATLDYKVTEDAMVYVSYSEGFKSGGFNGSASSEAAALRGFDPEKAKQWEVGLKSMWLDGQVRLNLTAFHIDYTDLQVFQLVNGAELVIDNAADATSKGFEAELTAALTKELTFNANYAYLDASYSSYITEDGEDFSGNRLTRSPEHSFNIAMTYQRDLGDWGVLTLQGDYAYRDEIFFNPDNFRLDDGRILVGDGSRSLLDAYVALEFVQQGLEVKLWGKNLTDELYRVHGIDGRGPFGLTNSAAVVYGLPRSYGVTVTWQFN